jgi:hypothetical protein
LSRLETAQQRRSREPGPPQVEQPQRNTPVAKELEGEWKGDYEMAGLYPACVDQVYESRTKRRGGGVVIVGRKHNNLPVDLVTQEGDLVTVDSHEIGFSFEDGCEMESSPA